MVSSTSLSAVDRLRAFLRPPGKGLYVHSTGNPHADAILKAVYGTNDAKEVQDAWEDSLQRIRRVEGIVLGIPSDTGAGILRGANYGPIGVRQAYLAQFGMFPKTVLDIGDVMVIPQLLHDEMLRQDQIQASRKALYGKDLDLPVSPLSVAEGALKALLELNPQLNLYLIGGDHSVSWPAMVYCHEKYRKNFGVLHFDAHTDLLETRLGIRYCFATWAYQAMQLMKPQHLVQVGIRTSKFPKAHWEQKYPLKQIWAHEVPGREKEVIAEVVEHFQELGLQGVYISNDIDGTDASFAPSTGTPETSGLHPLFVKELIQTVRRELPVMGGDVVEVAPPLSGTQDFSSEKTCRLGAEYLRLLFSSEK